MVTYSLHNYTTCDPAFDKDYSALTYHTMFSCNIMAMVKLKNTNENLLMGYIRNYANSA
jgi:hypothetical protein